MAVFFFFSFLLSFVLFGNLQLQSRAFFFGGVTAAATASRKPQREVSFRHFRTTDGWIARAGRVSATSQREASDFDLVLSPLHWISWAVLVLPRLIIALQSASDSTRLRLRASRTIDSKQCKSSVGVVGIRQRSEAIRAAPASLWLASPPKLAQSGSALNNASSSLGCSADTDQLACCHG